MTAQSRRRLALAILIPILGAVSVPLLTAAWRLKVDTSDYQRHVDAEELHHARDDARAERLESLSLDILCATKPSDRRCR